MRLLLSLLLIASFASNFGQGLIPCGMLAASPACFVAVRPGPATDVLSLVEIPDEDVSASEGELLLTTVLVQQDLTVFDLFRVQADPTSYRTDRSLYFPDDVDREDQLEQFAAMMRESEQSAVVAALRHLGYELEPDGVEIDGVLDDGPSAGVLEAGEVIVGADGQPVLDADSLATIIGQRSPGETVTFEVESADGGTEERSVTLGAFPDEPGRGFVGLYLVTRVAIPVEIDIDAGNIGGPSAGMMFALSLVDLLSEDDLTGGLTIAGTGEIDIDGRVGAIGGIRQKIAGSTERADGGPPASWFLAPRDNVEEARGAVTAHPITVVPIDTLGDAVRALQAIRTGGTPDGAFELSADPTLAGS